MVRRDLPDIYALALGRCAPSGSCVYIRQIPTDHVISIILHFRHSKICPNLMLNSRSLYIVMGIRCVIVVLYFIVVMTFLRGSNGNCGFTTTFHKATTLIMD